MNSPPTNRGSPSLTLVGESDAGRPRVVLLRVAAFVVALGMAYLVFQQITYWLFAPSLTVIGHTAPTGELPPRQPAVLSAEVVNEGRMAASAFAVVVGPSREQFEGPAVSVSPGDTAVVPVAVSFDPGDHVVSLVIFDAWRGIDRLRVFPGIFLRFGSRELEIRELVVPRRVSRGETFQVKISGVNPGQSVMTVVPELVFRPDTAEGPTVVIQGDGWEIGGGSAAETVIDVAPAALSAGTYFVEVLLKSPGVGDAGHSRYPIPLEVEA